MKYSHISKYLFIGIFLNNPIQAGSNSDLVTINANGRSSPTLNLITNCISNQTRKLDAKTRYTVQHSVVTGFNKLRHQHITKTYHLSNVIMTGYNELKKTQSNSIITIKSWGVFNRKIRAALQCGASQAAVITPGNPPIMVIKPPVNGSGSQNTVRPSKPAPPKPRNDVKKPPQKTQTPNNQTPRAPMVYKKFGGGVVTFSCKGSSSPSINSIKRCIDKRLKHDTTKTERDLLSQTVANGLKEMSQSHVVRVTSIRDILNGTANKSKNPQFSQHLKNLAKKHAKKLESCGRASGTARSCEAKKSKNPWGRPVSGKRVSGKRVGGKRVGGKRVSGKRVGSH